MATNSSIQKLDREKAILQGRVILCSIPIKKLIPKKEMGKLFFVG